MASRQRVLGLCASALVSTIGLRIARADNPDCSAVMNPNANGPQQYVVLAGATAQLTYISLLAAAEWQQGVTVVFAGPGSCVAVDGLLLDSTPSGSCASGACVTGTATYWTPNPTAGMPPVANTCNLAASGTHIDVAVSDIYAETCPAPSPSPGVLPSGYTEISAYAEAMTFVVPKRATAQQAILAEEAYFVFGFPNADGISTSTTPWNNDPDHFIRNLNSGTQNIIGYSIDVPPSRFLGVDSGSSGGVLSGVTGAANPNDAIGILGCDYYDSNRSQLTQLAFQTFGQKHAYYADSTPNAFDKQNVRDGHYLPWGYGHYTTANSNAAGTALLRIVSGQDSLAGFSTTDATITSHFVPQCAMHVKRTAEGNNLQFYTDPHPCDCYFEKGATGTLPASCTACDNSSPCSGSQQCVLGYCQ